MSYRLRYTAGINLFNCINVILHGLLNYVKLLLFILVLLTKEDFNFSSDLVQESIVLTFLTLEVPVTI